MAVLSFLDRDRSIAGPGFSRWLVPPAALAIHLSIGQAYAYSVFKIPMTTLIGITAPAPGDWDQATIAHMFQVAIAFLGISAALFGAWLERVGPRRAMFTAAVCFRRRVSGLGRRRRRALVLAGHSRLRRPRRHRSRARLHLAGLDADQVVPGPPGHGDRTRDHGIRRRRNDRARHCRSPSWRTSRPPHRWASRTTFVAMGIIYFIFMMFGVFTVRLPAPGWAPAGFVPKAADGQADHHRQCRRRRGVHDAAILAPLDRCSASTSPRGSASWSRPRR